MDNSLYIGLARQMTLRRELDITANNIANTSTAGFKAEHLLLETDTGSRARHQDGPDRLRFVDDWGLARDFRQGSMTQTGRPLDFAIEGEGFFVLETGAGDRFTRDGRFTLNDTGEIIASDGAKLLDDQGNPITVNPEGEELVMSESGQLYQGEALLGKVGVTSFTDLGLLEKVGDNRFRATQNDQREEADVMMRQGFTEHSNVNPILEMTRMMEVSRTYTSVSKMIQQSEDLSRRALERLGRA